MFAWMVLASALGQGLDQHGSTPPPGWEAGPVTVFTLAPERTSTTVGLLFELAVNPLVRLNEGVSSPVIGTLPGAQLQVGWNPHARFGFAATLPAHVPVSGEIRGAPSLSDAHLWLPVALLRGPVSVGAVPFVSLPTGDANRFLGDGGVGGGGLITAQVGGDAGGPALNAHLGMELDARGQGSFPGGPKGRAALSFGYHLQRGGLFLETRASLPTSGVVTVESLLTGSIAAGPLWLTGGAGRSLGTGPSGAALRAFAGIRWVPRRLERPSVVESEVIVTVRDPDGRAVRGARVSRGGEEVANTDHLGQARITPSQWSQALTVTAQGFRAARLSLSGVQDGAELQLTYAPVPVDIRVLGPDGIPRKDAVVTFSGETDALARPEAGPLSYRLAPGSWTVSVGAPGLATQTRRIVVEGGRTDPIRFEVRLSETRGGTNSLQVDVVDPLGRPVEGAVVTVDDTVLGSTATGGDIGVSGFDAGEVTLAVRHHRLQGSAKVDVVVGEDDRAISVRLGWREGSVLVVARGPNEHPTDALVRFRGPDTLPPTHLGVDGRRVFVLRPGEWTLLLSSPSLGLQQRVFSVPAGENVLTVVEVVLAPHEGGDSDVALRVLDPGGEALETARVYLDGSPLGATANQGVIRLEDLLSGDRNIVVEGAGIRRVQMPLRLDAGYQEIDLVARFEPGAMLVSARSGNRPVDALARGAAPGETGFTEQLGADGEMLTIVEPGRWDVLVSHPVHGLQQRTLDVAPDDEVLHRAEVIYRDSASGDRTLHVAVMDGEGAVSGAEVLLDGRTVGRTGSGGELSVGALASGTHEVVVRRRGYSRFVKPVALEEEVSRVSVNLEPLGTLVDVRVVAGDTPVTDAMIRVAGDTPPPRPWRTVDARGHARFGLSAGAWEFLASSEVHGLAQARAVLSASEAGPTALVIAFGEDPSDAPATLLLRVRDEYYAPVAGAVILEEGMAVGETTAGGGALLTLAPGEHTLIVDCPEPLRDLTLEVDLEPGSTEKAVRVDYKRVPVSVRGMFEGSLVPVLLTAEGPGMSVTGSGEEALALRPGPWTIVARSQERGLIGSVSVEVSASEPHSSLEIPLHPRRVALEEDRLALAGQVTFATDEVTIVGPGIAVVGEVAEYLRAHPEILLIEVQGHTDDTGGIDYNRELSRRRAAGVLEMLVAQGIAPERLISRGYGNEYPRYAGEDEAGRSVNRRVEFRVVE